MGIAKSTFYEWIHLGQAAPSGLHREFSDAIKKAQASAEARDLAVIDAAAQAGVWQAAAWKLERRSPERPPPTDEEVEALLRKVARRIVEWAPPEGEAGRGGAR